MLMLFKVQPIVKTISQTLYQKRRRLDCIFARKQRMTSHHEASDSINNQSRVTILQWAESVVNRVTFPAARVAPRALNTCNFNGKATDGAKRRVDAASGDLAAPWHLGISATQGGGRGDETMKEIVERNGIS
jgi:hypothetical protein